MVTPAPKLPLIIPKPPLNSPCSCIPSLYQASAANMCVIVSVCKGFRVKKAIRDVTLLLRLSQVLLTAKRSCGVHV